jgi:hypothetical protein
VRINGRTVSSYNTRGMIFGVAHCVARMSRYATLKNACRRRTDRPRLPSSAWRRDACGFQAYILKGREFTPRNAGRGCRP